MLDGTSLGPMGGWPERLRAVYDLVRGMQSAACLFWGGEATMLYNRAWARALGSRHPELFGAAARHVSADLAAACASGMRDAASGRPPSLPPELLPVPTRGPQGGSDTPPSCTALLNPDGAAEALLVQLPPAVAAQPLGKAEPLAADVDDEEGRAEFLLRLWDGLRGLTAPEDILDVGTELLRDVLSADSVTVIAADAARDADRASGVGRCAAGPMPPRGPGAGVGAPTLRTGRPLLTQLPLDPTDRTDEAVANSGHGGTSPPFRAQLHVPILAGNTPVASATVRHQRPHDWSAREIRTVREAALRIWETAERARVDSERRGNVARLAHALQTGGLAAVFLGCDGRLTEANDHFLALTKRSRAEVARGDLHWSDLMPPERTAEGQTLLAGLDATGGVESREVELVRTDGSRVWVMLTGRDLGDGTRVVFAIDISDRKGAEKGLEQANVRMNVAQEASGVMPFDWLIASTELEWSPTVSDVLGLREGAIGGAYEDWIAKIHADDHADATRAVEAALETGFLEGQWRIFQPDGATVWVMVRGTVEYDEQKRPTRITGAQVDITERVRAEQDLRFLVVEFDRQLEELRRQLRGGGK
ncbi:MAG: PAS domain-containing protein [Paracoccaceae bacterium]|nr:PAS domain-containing protein [Paracoccaceae bacterium]